MAQSEGEVIREANEVKLLSLVGCGLVDLGAIVVHLLKLLVKLSFVRGLGFFFGVLTFQRVGAVLSKGVLPQVVNHASIPLRDDALAVNCFALPQ